MLHRRLEELEAKGKPIRVGLVGCGRMGQGVINQIAQCKGMRAVERGQIVATRKNELHASSRSTSWSGQALQLDDVQPDEESMIYRLWRLQLATFPVAA